MQFNKAGLAGGTLLFRGFCGESPEIEGVVATDNVVEPNLKSDLATSGIACRSRKRFSQDVLVFASRDFCFVERDSAAVHSGQAGHNQLDPCRLLRSARVRV
jgi:hypothetical protein